MGHRCIAGTLYHPDLSLRELLVVITSYYDYGCQRGAMRVQQPTNIFRRFHKCAMRCATALTASCLRTHPGFLPGDISQLCIALLGSSYRFTVGRLSVSLAWLGAQAQGQGQDHAARDKVSDQPSNFVHLTTCASEVAMRGKLHITRSYRDVLCIDA
ncbi:hypothetical protein BC629DRAFT_1527536 [Irpex lacteus]|nr:hypothetical protein BC629DRAFT_1527536 [Irpex lacteus]